MSWLHIALLFASTFFAILTVKRLSKAKHMKKMLEIKRDTFILLTPGIAALAIAYLYQNILLFTGEYIFPSGADIFFSAAYILFALGLAYFAFRAMNIHKIHIKDHIFSFAVLCAVFIWLYYMFVVVIIPRSTDLPFLTTLLDYAYPVLVSIIFLLTLIIQPLLRMKKIRTPLWYISSGIFVYFLGYMMYTHFLWTTSAISLPPVYTALFMLSSIYFLLGFVAAKRKYS
jgi:hypothetical protein